MHTPIRGQGLGGGQLVAVKNGQRRRFNNSGSALELLPWSSDFYKLIIQAKTVLQVSLAMAPTVAVPDFPLGLQDGEAGHDLLLANKGSSECIH